MIECFLDSINKKKLEKSGNQAQLWLETEVLKSLSAFL